MSNRVLIVEDHPIFGEALQEVLRSSMSDVDVHWVETIEEAKIALCTKAFDLVLLDLWLPDTHGFEGLIVLRKPFPRVPIEFAVKWSTLLLLFCSTPNQAAACPV